MRILDYHPDQVARSLRVGKTLVIGMVIPDIRNPFYPEVVRGVEEASMKHINRLTRGFVKRALRAP